MNARTEAHRMWVEQCAAARVVRARYGEENALGYIVGEKLLNHLREAGRSPRFAGEVPSFVTEVRRLFTPVALARQLGSMRRTRGEDAPLVRGMRTLLLE